MRKVCVLGHHKAQAAPASEAPEASQQRPRDARRRWALAPLSVLLALALSACQGSASTGFLPAFEGGQATTETARVIDLWNGGWIALLVVGVLVWGAILWCVVRYRRRSSDTGLPPQLKYNMPIEILCTVLPVLMVVVFFYYTARDQTILLDTKTKPDMTIHVVSKQWAWDFNYLDADVYETSAHVELEDAEGKAKVQADQPVLYLPVGKRVEFILNARDVIHSFWIPAFLQKLDMLPGKTNKLHITPTLEGEFQGKCAELCGAYHGQMLFVVKVVSQAEFDAQMQKLRDIGQVGSLDNDLNQQSLLDKDAALVPAGSQG